MITVDSIRETPTAAESLRTAISTRTATFGVIGLGYVGLPLATAFAAVGFPVLGFDINQSTIDSLNRGVSHIRDVTDETVLDLVGQGQFSATTDMDRLAVADIISICVPTPLSKTRDLDISYVQAATEAVARRLRPGQLVILESTTYPGTTREVILPQLEATGLVAGRDFFLAFSPERIDPGNSIYGITNTPKVIGGLDPQSTELGAQFYQTAIQVVHPVSTPEAAEMVKLHENTFRAVNIALANETALMCDKLEIDVWEVIEAAKTKPFEFMPFYPGPGRAINWDLVGQYAQFVFSTRHGDLEGASRDHGQWTWSTMSNREPLGTTCPFLAIKRRFHSRVLL